MRAVLDPGVLVAALISRTGSPARLFLAWLAGHFELVASPHLIDELERVLRREKFRRYVSTEDALTYVEVIRQLATGASDHPAPRQLSVDPDDDYLLALAVSARAEVLVSGDPHLLDVDPAPTRVLSPADFVRELGLDT